MLSESFASTEFSIGEKLTAENYPQSGFHYKFTRRGGQFFSVAFWRVTMIYLSAVTVDSHFKEVTCFILFGT